MKLKNYLIIISVMMCGCGTSSPSGGKSAPPSLPLIKQNLEQIKGHAENILATDKPDVVKNEAEDIIKNVNSSIPLVNTAVTNENAKIKEIDALNKKLADEKASQLAKLKSILMLAGLSFGALAIGLFFLKQTDLMIDAIVITAICWAAMVWMNWIILAGCVVGLYFIIRYVYYGKDILPTSHSGSVPAKPVVVQETSGSI